MFESLEDRRLMSSSVGLQGVYFDNSNFTGTTKSRVDSQVNFSWSSAPISGIGADTFSVRWTGKITPQTSEKYTFFVTSDNGARLWVNHKLIIDNWTSHSKIENSGSITLTAKKAYDIQLEFWDNTGSATAQLKWKSNSVAKATIPSSRLAPAVQNLKSMLDHDLAFSSAQLKRTMADLGKSHSKFVNRTNSNGTWNVVNADDWTSGFLGGQMWQLFSATGDSAWKTNATAWTTPLASEATKQNGDLAFRLMTTFLPLYQQTGNAAYKQVLLNAAASKETTWNETIGAFTTTWRKSTSGNPDANFGVLMDQTTDMQLMLWAAQNGGDPNYATQALRHVRNVIANMVRPDGSTYQWGYFNTTSGGFVDGETYQGFANNSTQARAGVGDLRVLRHRQDHESARHSRGRAEGRRLVHRASAERFDPLLGFQRSQNPEHLPRHLRRRGRRGWIDPAQHAGDRSHRIREIQIRGGEDPDIALQLQVPRREFQRQPRNPSARRAERAERSKGR